MMTEIVGVNYPFKKAVYKSLKSIINLTVNQTEP